MIPSFLSADELATQWLRSKLTPEGALRVLFLDLDGVLFHENKGDRHLLVPNLKRLVRTCYEANLTVVLVSDAWPGVRTVQALAPVLGPDLTHFLDEVHPRIEAGMPRNVGVSRWLAGRIVRRTEEVLAGIVVVGVVDDCVRHYPDADRDILVACNYDEGYGVKQDARVRHNAGLSMTEEWFEYPDTQLFEGPDGEL